MPKKTKTHSNENRSSESQSQAVPAKSEKPKRRTTGGSKKPGLPTKAPKKAKKSPASVQGRHPSDEEVRIRAYFISERRRRFGLAGDAHADWVEARRQLLSEANSQ